MNIERKKEGNLLAEIHTVVFEIYVFIRFHKIHFVCAYQLRVEKHEWFIYGGFYYKRLKINREFYAKIILPFFYACVMNRKLGGHL
jgi:hypothetical protein